MAGLTSLSLLSFLTTMLQLRLAFISLLAVHSAVVPSPRTHSGKDTLPASPQPSLSLTGSTGLESPFNVESSGVHDPLEANTFPLDKSSTGSKLPKVTQPIATAGPLPPPPTKLLDQSSGPTPVALPRFKVGVPVGSSVVPTPVPTPYIKPKKDKSKKEKKEKKVVDKMDKDKGNNTVTFIKPSETPLPPAQLGLKPVPKHHYGLRKGNNNGKNVTLPGTGTATYMPSKQTPLPVSQLPVMPVPLPKQETGLLPIEPQPKPGLGDLAKHGHLKSPAKLPVDKYLSTDKPNSPVSLAHSIPARPPVTPGSCPAAPQVIYVHVEDEPDKCEYKTEGNFKVPAMLTQPPANTKGQVYECRLVSPSPVTPDLGTSPAIDSQSGDAGSSTSSESGTKGEKEGVTETSHTYEEDIPTNSPQPSITPSSEAKPFKPTKTLQTVVTPEEEDDCTCEDEDESTQMDGGVVPPRTSDTPTLSPMPDLKKSATSLSGAGSLAESGASPTDSSAVSTPTPALPVEFGAL